MAVSEVEVSGRRDTGGFVRLVATDGGDNELPDAKTIAHLSASG